MEVKNVTSLVTWPFDSP